MKYCSGCGTTDLDDGYVVVIIESGILTDYYCADCTDESDINLPIEMNCNWRLIPIQDSIPSRMP